MRGREVLQRGAVPIALGLGAVALLFEAALVRAGTVRFDVQGFHVVAPHSADAARQSRYLYLIAAMLLPAIAFAAESVLRRWRKVAPIIGILLLVGVFGNVSQLHHDAARYGKFGKVTRNAILAAPYIPLAKELPRSLRPASFGFEYNDVSLGWLIECLS
jgi:hypothetical protein